MQSEELGGVSIAEEELTAAIAAPVPVVAGMTRAEFKEWKEIKTRTAQEQLQGLEERLQRLQVEGQDKNKRGLSIGDRVQLHSLLRTPELNGVCGKVVTPQNRSTGRLVVEIENNGRVVALQPGNIARLCDCADCCIQLHRPILRCSQCMNAAYCSKTCQSKAWKAGHKHKCMQDGSARAGASMAHTAKTKFTADRMNMPKKVRNKHTVRS